MNVLEHLATTLGRNDELPNQELANQIVEKNDKQAIQDLCDHLKNKNKNIQHDCIKVLYEVGAQKPDLIAPFLDTFIELLTSKNNRLQWGAMTAIGCIPKSHPKEVYKHLPTIIQAADSGSVITRDHAVNVLINLHAIPTYQSPAFELLLEQLLNCPTNQLAMYAERATPIINDLNKLDFVKVLKSRLDEIEKESKKKRVEKVIKLIQLTIIFLFMCCISNGHAQIQELKDWLAVPNKERVSLDELAFSKKALTTEQAAIATRLLFEDHQANMKRKYDVQWENRLLILKDLEMPFFYQKFGTEPAEGRSLFISLHGGGGAPDSVNDQQYDNQKHLYDATMKDLEGVYMALRAPTNTWDLWHQSHIDDFLNVLIQMAVIKENVNPNKIYIMGYSAGGDGLFQLAPRMADRWAAASMMAGHPGDASPLSLRNTPFAIHMGALDAAYNRNGEAEKWKIALEELRKTDPEGYEYDVQIHEGMGHWMELKDAVALPWMQKFERDPIPQKLVWKQDNRHHQVFSWLGIPERAIQNGALVSAKYNATLNEINILHNDSDTLDIFVNDQMLNLDTSIVINDQDKLIYQGKISRNIINIYKSIQAKGDKNVAFSGSITIVNNQVASSPDWLIDGSIYEAKVNTTSDQLTITNGLIERVIKLSPNAATISLNLLSTNTSILRAVKPEAEVAINGKSYAIGGLTGQPNHAFLDPAWIDALQLDSNAWMFIKYEISEPVAPFGWKRVRHHQQDLNWPPKGVHLALEFEPPVQVGLNGLKAIVHYECYDGLPVIAKWLEIVNAGEQPIVVDDFASEIIAAVEYGSSVESREYNVLHPNIHVETDYAFASMYSKDANHHVVHWETDPEYHTQVNYNKQTPCLLKVSPEIGPGQTLLKGDTMHSFRTFVLPHESFERERQGLSIRKMYRTIAPWVTENPLMMHARFADWDRVKLAIDQAAEVGFEMVILTFGSGFNIENEDPAYIAEMKKYADYARSKGIEIGGYSLLSSRDAGPSENVILPEGESAMFGQAPCIGSKWGQDYFRKLYAFYPKTGFSLLEHDGSYPGDYCISTTHPGHQGFEDSRWNQYAVISQFYKWCRSEGIYLNIPDYYYLTGGNKCGMGYRETNWSLPRAQQVIHTRQNIYDGTWEKTGSMGWMFVPLTEYHGGGEAATIEPLDEHLDHYEMMMSSNLSAGVQACYRGPRLYDTERTKAMVKGQVGWFKKHREVLEGDLIHLRRADGRNLDYWLMVNPKGTEKGALVVFNPTDHEITKTIEVPLYYTGLTEQATVYTDSETTGTFDLDRSYRIKIDVSITANVRGVYFIK